MPIQVISTYKKIPSPPVDLVSAGEDVFPVCDVTIFLTAIVDPLPNLQGHTILWEQLSGTPVVLNNDDQLTANFLQLMLDETDKEFRVTIDKDLPIEQTDTVIVYATPTSLTATSFPEANVMSFVPSSAVEASSFSVTTSAVVPPPAGVIDPDVPVTPSFLIEWDLPPDALLLPFLTTMTLFEDDIPVGVFTSSDPLEYQGGQNIYNVLSDYVVNGHPSIADSDKIDYTNEVIPSTHVVDDSIQTTTFVKSTVKISTFPNVVQTAEDESITAFSASDPIIARFINTNENAIDSAPAGFTFGTSNVTRTDPGGIGGG